MGKVGHRCLEWVLATDPLDHWPLEAQQLRSFGPLGRASHFCDCSDGHDWKVSPKQLENSPKITKVEKQTALDCPGQKWRVEVKSLWCVGLWVFIYLFGEEEGHAEAA